MHSFIVQNRTLVLLKSKECPWMLNSANLTEHLSFQFTIFIAQLLKQGEKQTENQPSDKH